MALHGHAEEGKKRKRARRARIAEKVRRSKKKNNRFSKDLKSPMGV